MGCPFFSEVRIFANQYPPKGWAYCDGQTLDISQNISLYSLLGTSYGGDGINTFGLPNLKGRITVCMAYSSTGLACGELFGQASVQLTADEIPSHTHEAHAIVELPKESGPDSEAFYTSVRNNGSNSNAYATPTAPPTNLTPLAEQTMTYAGGSQPHNNYQPFLALFYCIAIDGLYPARP